MLRHKLEMAVEIMKHDLTALRFVIGTRVVSFLLKVSSCLCVLNGKHFFAASSKIPTSLLQPTKDHTKPAKLPDPDAPVPSAPPTPGPWPPTPPGPPLVLPPPGAAMPPPVVPR